MHTAAALLKMTEPGELFSEDPLRMREEFSQLAMHWHPDRNIGSEQAHEVMAYINALYATGMTLLRSGCWRKPGTIRLTSRDVRKHEIRFLREVPFELGTTFIGDSAVAYLLDEASRSEFDNAERAIRSNTFSSIEMETEISKCLPKIISLFETTDRRKCMVLEKPPGLLRLEDVRAHYGGRLPDRHVAWIMGSLYNLACYLAHSGTTHNAISADTCWISPALHYTAVLGGWWHSVPLGTRMRSVPSKTFSVMPPQVARSKESSTLTDLECIRLVGRELLGDPSGTHLDQSDAPLPLVQWLKGAASHNAIEEYANWRTVLTASYGERRFVELKLDRTTLYG